MTYTDNEKDLMCMAVIALAKKVADEEDSTEGKIVNTNDTDDRLLNFFYSQVSRFRIRNAYNNEFYVYAAKEFPAGIQPASEEV